MTAAAIPYGAYWSTPFARWQGSLAHLHAIQFAAHVARAELARRAIAATAFDYGVLGTTVPQPHSFFGLPWLMGMIGAERVPGPTINQACATGVRCLAAGRQEIAAGDASAVLALSADRVSNGPHLYYPEPQGMGGTGTAENWVTDNFSHDPFAKVAMIDTAENVARRWQITTAEQHDVVLRRYSQYDDALADDHAFQKRYMTLPFPVPDRRLRKDVGALDGDEGVHATSADALAKLKPMKDGGTVTFGGQTHPADGNAAVILTTPERVAEFTQRPEIDIRIVAFGQARAEPAYMPFAPVLASRQALERADLKIADLAAIKSHNPFVVNDIVFARETGADVQRMNNYGCSLVWGHPQGPTGLRGVIELIEELVARGGGRGLFHGCAAGDSSMAVIVSVSDRT
ncbi:MAG: thiolase family protein [Proteobacteria bacterium]|nr:thiolase family protein [Pseudomonadota bacterium]